MKKKILMALMGLEIGGVETHVLELATELVKRGHDVTVASNGGIFQKDLEEAQVRHLWAPLHNKNPFNILKARAILKKDINSNNYDIVHGHARIPSAILGGLQKKLKFPFITSAHWVFKTRFPYNLITNWGERCVAVSDDIKQYLIDNYRYPARNIATTINGINTDKFSSETDISDILREFPIDKKKTQICYVSRMDTDRSAAAFHLIKALVKMRRDDVQAVIIGGGDDYNRLEEEVGKANNILGKDAIVTTGSRVDINKFIANCDIFVGVSRAVLEAMSASKQVICAGNEGYIGIINDDTYIKARETNFCCRGCEQSTPELILKDLEELLMDKGESNENRNKILTDYSVSKMTDDYEAEYNKLSAKKVMMCGYYGYKNLGDDCLLATILDSLYKMDIPVDVEVLSANPISTNLEYGVRATNRFNIFKLWKSMKKSDLLIMGGGSILQDVTSTRSILYYIFIMKLANVLGLKFMLYANGLGPIRKEANRRKTANILEKASVITVREKDSYQYIRELGVENQNVYITADPAFNLSKANDERISEILEKNGITKDYFVISVRQWDNNKEFTHKMVSLCVKLKEIYNITPVFIIMQASHDDRITRSICSRISGAKILEVYEGTKDVIGVIGEAKFMIGMRLHAIIYAASGNVPFVAISYDPKVEAVSEALDMCEFVEKVEDFDIERIIKNVDKLGGKKEVLEEKVEFLRHQTLKDVACVKKILTQS